MAKDKNIIMLSAVLQHWSEANLLFDHEFLYSRYLPQYLVENIDISNPPSKDSLWSGEKVTTEFHYEIDGSNRLVCLERKIGSQKVKNGKTIEDSSDSGYKTIWHFVYK